MPNIVLALKYCMDSFQFENKLSVDMEKFQ